MLCVLYLLILLNSLQGLTIIFPTEQQKLFILSQQNTTYSTHGKRHLEIYFVYSDNFVTQPNAFFGDKLLISRFLFHKILFITRLCLFLF